MLRLRVKEVAEAKGYTISSLSRRSDISIRTIRRLWRQPETIITTETLEKLAIALEVTAAELIQNSDS
ncbi:MAG: helix-turn-helix domain-containing protein [Ktedonobacteraceae bacterium]